MIEKIKKIDFEKLGLDKLKQTKFRALQIK